MQKNIVGYQYWFHIQLDFRQLAKAEGGGPLPGCERDISDAGVLSSGSLEAAGRRRPGLAGVVVVRSVMRALPGDPAAYFAGNAATKEAIEQVRPSLVSTEPAEQFAVYVRDLARGDLGQSVTTDSRAREMPRACPLLELTSPPSSRRRRRPARGRAAAHRPGSWVDQGARSTTAGVSLPPSSRGYCSSTSSITSRLVALAHRPPRLALPHAAPGHQLLPPRLADRGTSRPSARA
jgi:hypothetical protein